MFSTILQGYRKTIIGGVLIWIFYILFHLFFRLEWSFWNDSLKSLMNGFLHPIIFFGKMIESAQINAWSAMGALWLPSFILLLPLHFLLHGENPELKWKTIFFSFVALVSPVMAVFVWATSLSPMPGDAGMSGGLAMIGVGASAMFIFIPILIVFIFRIWLRPSTLLRVLLLFDVLFLLWLLWKFLPKILLLI